MHCKKKKKEKRGEQQRGFEWREKGIKGLKNTRRMGKKGEEITA